MYLVLTVASLLSVFPLYYMFCASTNRSIDVIAGKLIPGTYLMENFKSLIAQQNLRLALWNSFRNATVLTVLCLLVCSIAGYGFEIYHDKAKDAVFTVLLTAMMIPFAAIMIPMFRMFSQLKMVNTMAAFMLPSISTPFMIMMFRQASRSFPHDIIEAARLDGLSETGIFFRMYMPTMKSTYAAATIITFMNAWNNYLWPKVILQNNDSITMPMLVANLLGGYTVDYGVLMLGVFICTIPTAIIFFCFQKSFLICLKCHRLAILIQKVLHADRHLLVFENFFPVNQKCSISLDRQHKLLLGAFPCPFQRIPGKHLKQEKCPNQNN